MAKIGNILRWVAGVPFFLGTMPRLSLDVCELEARNYKESVYLSGHANLGIAVMLISMFLTAAMNQPQGARRTCCVLLFRAKNHQEKITCSKLEAAAFLQDLRSDLEKLLEESMVVPGGFAIFCDAKILS